MRARRWTAAGVLGSVCGLALAGGSGDNIIIIADPLNPESMYAANYYKAARGVPDTNVLYIYPGAADYQSFVAFNLAALEATVAERGLEGQADVILLMPGAPFYIDAAGLVNDGCSEVRRFSISGAYTTAFVADEVLGGVQSSYQNRYASGSFSPYAFDSEVGWLSGSPSGDPNARRYYLGAMLGYTGERGNTLQEILDNVDRSAAVDYTRPGGTFYFCQTGDNARSSPRHNSFPAVVAEIMGLGGSASHEMRQIPRNQHDVLSILTGIQGVDLSGANMTILPGAYCDHLTSYGAMFDNATQMKISEWIRYGATATHGTVEEPCNYPGKFTHARSMIYYYHGASMGESIFRALSFTPFQGLVYGDPMCRPFDYPVTVTVDQPPQGPLSGVVEITPEGSTDKPFMIVADFDLLLDNRRVDRDFRLPLTLDTREHADGWHTLAALGYDTSAVRSVGKWEIPVVIDNLGRSAEIAAQTTTGDHSTRFGFDVSSVGGGLGGEPVEIRLVHNGRVLDAAPGCSGSLGTSGLQLGAGISRVHAEALFADGMRVRSAPVQVVVAYTDGTPSGDAPGSAQFTAWAGGRESLLVELPSDHDDASEPPVYEIVDAPAQADIVPGPDGPYRMLAPRQGASGFDVMTYRVTTGAGQSQLGRVVVVYDRHPYDLNGDGSLDIDDLHAIEQTGADINFDGAADAADKRLLRDVLRCGELRDMSAGR